MKTLNPTTKLVVCIVLAACTVLAACASAENTNPAFDPTTPVSTAPPDVARPDTTVVVPDVTVTIDEGPPVVTQLSNGVTHGQHSADAWQDAHAITKAWSYLDRNKFLQNQHMMGWGALSPEPSPGEYDWTTLDDRINVIRHTGGEPVITLCCSPDWMKGGEAGQTDWSKIEKAPDLKHYDDFANLAAAVASRYPDVKYFQVWNELKGFYSVDKKRWDYEHYTYLYNKVYDAVKKVRPDAQLGGPYAVMESYPDEASTPHPSGIRGDWGVLDQASIDVVNYWLKNKHGAEFISIDAKTMARDGHLVTDEFTATTKFTAITEMLRKKTDLPIWWSEWFVTPKDAGWDPDHQNAVMTTAVIRLASAGATTALLWQPEGQPNHCGTCLWPSTTTSAGGDATPFGDSLQAFAWAFPPGTVLKPTTSSDSHVVALASDARAVLVNTSDKHLTVRLVSAIVELAPYQVAYIKIEK